MRSAFLGINAA